MRHMPTLVVIALVAVTCSLVAAPLLAPLVVAATEAPPTSIEPAPPHYASPAAAMADATEHMQGTQETLAEAAMEAGE